MWSIIALTFENRNYAKAYKSHLENKTTIKGMYRGLIICIPWNIKEKQLIHLGGWNFGCHKANGFKPKLAAGRTSKIRVIDATFRSHGDFYAEKYSNGIPMKFMECLNEYAKNKRHFLYIRSRVILIATNCNLLDSKYEFYGFNEDLGDTIN